MRQFGGAVLMWQLALLLLSGGLCSGEGEETRQIVGQKVFISPKTCGTCHPRQFESYMQSSHRRAGEEDGDSDVYCAQCHGDGVNHVRNRGGGGTGIFAFSERGDAHEKSAKCLACHFRSPELKMWDFGTHERHDVSCDDCHTMHPASHNRESEQQRCFSCHQRVAVEANKRSHHPILEGRMECSSCHHPHGTMTPGLVRTINAQALCYSCHADKRGPAVWIHPPVEENCQNCHRPHGSIHANLLVDRVPQLCRNCHDWSRYPGSPYGDTAGSGSGRCAQNHPAIHGSSAPSGGAERLSR